jgi:hypothetical protein
MIKKGFGMGVARVRRDGKYVKVERESDEMVFGASVTIYSSSKIILTSSRKKNHASDRYHH